MAHNTTWTEVLEFAAAQYEENLPLLPMYIHMILAAMFPIFAGAFASLSRPASAAPAPHPPLPATASEDDDDEEETVHLMEGLDPQDAIIFPITAGVVLAGLYFLIKRYGAKLINLILGWYMSIVGIYSVAKFISDTWTLLDNVIAPSYYRDQGIVWKLVPSKQMAVPIDSGHDGNMQTRSSPLPGIFARLPLPQSLIDQLWSARQVSKQKFTVKGYMKDIFEFSTSIRLHHIASSLIGIFAVLYSILVEKPWWLTNLQGFAVSYSSLQLMSPTTFGTGSLILCGLFFYDIWAVFFTPLMVTVATNLDVPIKLVIPRNVSQVPGEKPKREYSILGLGDIVLPGIMIALALRFDLYLFYLKKQKRKTESSADSKLDSDFSIEKAQYTSAGGHWGDRLWTLGCPKRMLPLSLSAPFPKPYFTAAMIGYIVGMIATLIAMTLSHHGQPALLYLVPGVLTSLWGTSWARGELQAMCEYTEAINGEPMEQEDGTAASSSSTTDAPTSKAESNNSAYAGGFFNVSSWMRVFGLGGNDPQVTKTEEQRKTPSSAKTGSSEQATTRDADCLFTFSVSLRQSPLTAESKTTADIVEVDDAKTNKI